MVRLRHDSGNEKPGRVMRLHASLHQGWGTAGWQGIGKCKRGKGVEYLHQDADDSGVGGIAREGGNANATNEQT